MCVRDAFYNVRGTPLAPSFMLITITQLPIRRLSHPSPHRTLELIRKDIETIALVSPHVAFTLEDTRIVDTIATRPDRRRILSIPKVRVWGSSQSCYPV